VPQYCADAYHEYLAHYDPRSRDDLIARLYNEQTTLNEKQEPIPFHVSDEGIVEEVTNLLFAGTDTTSNTLTYLFWELARNPEWLGRMRKELNDAIGEQGNPPYSTISELPILDAVIYELLRLWPAAPASLQRVTGPEGIIIDGLFVPPNVR
jgi:cytochrome P450